LNYAAQDASPTGLMQLAGGVFFMDFIFDSLFSGVPFGLYRLEYMHEHS
jgi:hypothetical protein